MKKAITILAVLIVLVGAVFADETHTIKVKADVDVVIPVFGLKMSTPANNYVTNEATLVNRQGNTTEYTTEYGKGATYGMTDNANAIDVAFNLDEEGSVTFQALLLNKAKQRETYNLTFGGGVFTVSRQGTSGLSYGPDKITTSVGDDITGLSIALGNNAPTGQPAEGAATNKIVGLTFDGKTVNDGINHVLAEAVYHYPGDETIDPTLNGTFYYADVTLLISAT